jgi:uncharacterized membrane protein
MQTGGRIMEVSNGFLLLGIVMTLVGIFMVYLSLRAKPEEVKTRGLGIFFLGPIPIIIGGSRKWIITALSIVFIIMFFLATKNIRPDLIGW